MLSFKTLPQFLGLVDTVKRQAEEGKLSTDSSPENTANA